MALATRRSEAIIAEPPLAVACRQRRCRPEKSGQAAEGQRHMVGLKLELEAASSCPAGAGRC